jgi:hypothetical protein
VTEIQSITCAGDVALGQQRVERNEQIQIEEMKVHFHALSG